MAKKKTQAEIAQMQQASAAGNSPVESAATNNDRVPLDSVNASQQPLTANMQAPALPKQQVSVNPNVPSSVEISLGRGPEQLLAKKQIEGNREMYKKAVEDAYNKAQNTEVTTEQTSIAPVKFREYKNTPYNATEGLERVNKNAGLLSLIDERKKLDKEYQDKAEKASKQAKMAAWGNLFTALGQLAGGAKQTYVRPDSKYLTDAMAKSDKAREVYEAIKLQNKKAEDDYRAKLLAQDEASHYANEKAYNESVKKHNDTLLEFAKANPTKIKKVYDPNAKDEMDIKQQTANAATKRAQAAMINANKDDNKSEGKPYINYQDYETKINYNLNESEALRIAKYLIKKKAYTSKTLGLVSSEVSGTVEDIKDRALLKSEVLAYIEGNPNDEYVLKVLKGSKDRERSSQSKPDIDINE